MQREKKKIVSDMKNLRNILAAWLLMVGATAFADDYAYLSIVETGGQSEVSINNIKNITFDDTNMLINLTDGNQQKLPLSGLTKMFFSGESTSIQSVAANGKQTSFALKDGVLHVAGAQGANITVFDVNGKAVRNVIATRAETEINLSGLTKGVYIVRVGDQTKKILNK